MLSEGSIVDSRGVQKIKLSPFRLFSINTFPIAYPARATFSTESSTRMVLAQPWTTCPALLRLVVTVVSRWWSVVTSRVESRWPLQRLATALKLEVQIRSWPSHVLPSNSECCTSVEVLTASGIQTMYKYLK